MLRLFALLPLLVFACKTPGGRSQTSADEPRQTESINEVLGCYKATCKKCFNDQWLTNAKRVCFERTKDNLSWSVVLEQNSRVLNTFTVKPITSQAKCQNCFEFKGESESVLWQKDSNGQYSFLLRTEGHDYLYLASKETGDAKP